MDFRIKEAREKVGLTQKELAIELGIKPNTFNGYEKGTHDPKSEILKKIAIRCNTTVDYLLGIDNDTNNVTARTEITDINRKQLLCNYDFLNDRGKEKLLEYSEDLINSTRYIKSRQNEMIALPTAARSTENRPVEFTYISKEKLEQIENAESAENEVDI